MAVDLERAQALFGGDDLGWIVDRLRARLERGQPVDGRLRLEDADAGQREALQRLVGRRPRSSRSISIDTSELADVLARAGIASDLRSLVEELCGPLTDRAAAAREELDRWTAVMRRLRTEARAIDAVLERWVDELEASGLLRRLAGGVEAAERMANESLAVLRRLPAGGVPLAQLAAEALGDSHALDDGAPQATLVLRAVEMRTGLPRRDRSAAERRSLWARAGVLLDELSAPALVAGLRPAGEGLLARTLRAHAEAGEPCRVTLGQLVRHRPAWARLEAASVALCENPTVVAAAASRLSTACPGLVCTEGLPSGAVQTLLAQLVEAGVVLWFHADFDVGGVRVGNLLVDRFGARPWRMGFDDYETAAAGATLTGVPDVAVWDRRLSAAMVRKGYAVYEEQLLDTLLADLRAWPDPVS